MTTAADLHVTGRVQGVSYRAAMQQEAERLGVTGWVRNEPDGSVAAHVEGEAAAVDALVAWCRRGPSGSRVRDVAVRRVGRRRAPGVRDPLLSGPGPRVVWDDLVGDPADPPTRSPQLRARGEGGTQSPRRQDRTAAASAIDSTARAASSAHRAATSTEVKDCEAW